MLALVPITGHVWQYFHIFLEGTMPLPHNFVLSIEQPTLFPPWSLVGLFQTGIDGREYGRLFGDHTNSSQLRTMNRATHIFPAVGLDWFFHPGIEAAAYHQLQPRMTTQRMAYYTTHKKIPINTVDAS